MLINKPNLPSPTKRVLVTFDLLVPAGATLEDVRTYCYGLERAGSIILRTRPKAHLVQKPKPARKLTQNMAKQQRRETPLPLKHPASTREEASFRLPPTIRG